MLDIEVANLLAFASRADIDSSRFTVRELINQRQLVPHFQPVVRLTDGTIYGHEALIRTPKSCPWQTPDALFAAARQEGVAIDLEIECVRLALQAWSRAEVASKLFVNLSAGALVTALLRDMECILTVADRQGATRPGIIVELTEHEHVRDVDELASAVGRLRRHRVALALDDFGDGSSSLRLWSELKPEIVKIDKYFTQGLAKHGDKLQTLRALMQISEIFGSNLVAEGIETSEDLHLVRDLGIKLGQGWVLGHPQEQPATATLAPALAVIHSRDVAVFPERRRAAQQRANAINLIEDVPPVAPTLSNETLFDLFNRNPDWRSVAIVENAEPVGLVNRQQFINRYAQPYIKELYGRKPCMLMANLTPRLMDIRADIEELTAVLTSDDQRYLSEGFIITEAGRYRGMGSGEQLVRTVTEARMEAARHANPLTLLPGNIPIMQHIARLLAKGREFVACYADLNHFKPFNDQYGYWRGDQMIQLASQTLLSQIDAQRDFLGHVGGDDFVLLFQSDDWESRCHAIVDIFDRRALDLFDQEARQAGGIHAEDRYGDLRFHPLTTLSIGAVAIDPAKMRGPEDVANAAASAKRAAKASAQRVCVLDAGTSPSIVGPEGR